MRIYPGTISRMAVAHDQIHKLPFTHYLDLAAAVAVAVICLGTAAAIAFLKGLNHHTVMVSGPRAVTAPPRAELPGPRLPDPLGAWRDPDRDTPFAGTAYWPSEPEPVPVVAVAEPDPVKVCEGPSCPYEVPDRPWVCGTVDGDQDEEHEFCSKDCLQEWVRVQQEACQQAAPRPRIGATIRKYW